jgi:PAS domain S-box-containing protein
VAFDPVGRPQRVIGTCQNVTARRRSDEALRTSQAATRMLSHVASRTENPVVITGADGTIEWANESFSRLTGFAVAEVRGALLLDLLSSPDADPRALERVTEAIVKGQAITTDVAAVSRDKERRYHLRLELQPVRHEGGAVENFIALATDMTARVETENELRRAKAEADAASRAKSDFLASMSHEIRTPMNGVIGMTSLLLETELTPEQKDYVSTIRTSGDALLAIINEILDFSKIESGKMELERQPFELAQCLEEALDIFALQAAAKGIELAYYVDANVPPWIEGDVTRLRQVLVNLVNNAVKFTPHGTITVEVHVSTVETSPGFHVAHEEEGRLMLDFFVADTGIGIPPERQHLLFKPFSQVDTSTTRKFGGTGLGLAICDRLCHLMGGSIDVTSKPGEGSTFRFSIQVKPVPALVEESLPDLPARLHGRHVLVMDDHAINRANLGRAVATLGLTPLETHNLYNAAELAVQHKLAAAVIDDQGEYGEKGSMLAMQLREQHPTLPIVLYLNPVETVRRSDSSDPFLVRLTKPVKPALFRQVLAQLFQEPDAAETRPPMALSEDVPRLAAEIPLDVLLVEDNPVNQKVALRFLDRLGYRADAVGNGVEAVRTLQQRDYDLVLMDIQMPEMDGFTATREIRAKLLPARQPKIIALTANAVQGDRERCLAVGMDDYLSKPVKLEALEQAIRRNFPRA